MIWAILNSFFFWEIFFCWVAWRFLANVVVDVRFGSTFDTVASFLGSVNSEWSCDCKKYSGDSYIVSMMFYPMSLNGSTALCWDIQCVSKFFANSLWMLSWLFYDQKVVKKIDHIKICKNLVKSNLIAVYLCLDVERGTWIYIFYKWNHKWIDEA